MAYNDELSGSVVLDIETVASPDVAALLDPVKAPSNYKDAAKIAAYQAEKQAERIATAGLEADLCEIVAIGFTMSDAERTIEALTRQDATEEQMIQTLWQIIGHRRIVGFNCLGFDLPVLIRRSQLLGIRFPAVNLDRYRTPHVDLLEKLTFNGRLTMRSLRFYARRFGVQSILEVDQVTGSDIARLVTEEDWSAIKTHVAHDVMLTASLAKRLGYLSEAP